MGRRLRLGLFYLLGGAVAALVGGFLTGMLIALFTSGPLALVTTGPILGLFGAAYGAKVAILPATLLGGLLWWRGVSSKLVWAGTGVMGGIVCYAMVALFPEWLLGEGMGLGRDWPLFAAALPLAGAPAALAFRLLMETVTAFDEALTAD
jgi:hypothetical protein